MGLALLVVLVVAGAVVPTPFVAIGRGPTYDVLGEVGGKSVITIRTLTAYHPAAGHLNMTTVSVTDGLTGFEALRRWASPDFQVVPRSSVFLPGQNSDQIAQRNQQDFSDSQINAEGAALAYLHLPTIVVVDGLAPDSASAGVLADGDVLLAIAGRPITTYDDLSATLGNALPGQQVAVRYQRGSGPPQNGTVTLGKRASDNKGALGIFPGVRPMSADEIMISLGDVGGPSAGLMFSLGVVDNLTPGDLTGGRFIAGTGTIGSTGIVGEIEGIRFKMAAAREAGATAFLVPAKNCDAARESAPDGLQLIKVDDLTGAVASIATLTSGGTPAGC